MGILSKERLSGLSVRYLLTLFAEGLFLSLLLIWYASFQQRTQVFGELERRGALLGRSLAAACALPYALGDAAGVSRTLSGARSFEDVVSVSILGPEGREDYREGPPLPEGEAAPLPAGPGLSVWTQKGRLHVLCPLQEAAESPPAGWVHVVLSLDRARGEIRTLVLHAVLATLAIVLLGSWVSFIFFRRTVVHPIRRLVDGMRAVKEGRLGIELDGLSGAGEVGVLTRSFNQMSEELQWARDEILKANSELEARVQERTRDLERVNRELKESRDKAVRSEKLAAIGRLASGVGHELRNPLGAIRNAIYYIRDSVQGSELAAADPTLGEFFDLADKEIKSATRIIGDLLEFSRVVKLAPQPTDLNELVSGIKASLEVPANVRIVESYQEGLPKAFIDTQRMRQVFLNLATNAIQAMPKGGELALSTRAEGGELAVEFRDSGSGIPPENLKKIFEPLFTTKAKGTGLGLSICQGYVEAHGGRITAESPGPGGGSTFTVRFPAGRTEEPA